MTAAGAMMAAPLLGVMRVAQQAGDQIRELARAQRISEVAAGRRLGFSESETEAAVAFSEAMEEVQHSLRRTYVTIAGALAPTIREFASWVTSVSVQVRAWARQHPELVQRLAAVAAGAVAAGAAITALGVAIVGAAAVVKVMIAVGGVLTGLLLSWPGILAGLAAAIAAATVDWRGLGEQMSATWQAMVNAIKGGDIETALKIVVAQLKVIWFEFLDWFRRNTSIGMSWVGQLGDDISSGLAALAVKLGEVVGAISKEQAQFMIADILRQNRLAIEQLEEQRRKARLPSAELQQAREELEKLRQRAMQLPPGGGRPGAPAAPPRMPRKEYPPDIAVQVRGTYSSQAISQSLALGDRFSERMAKGIERAARAGEETVRLLRNMRGIAFT